MAALALGEDSVSLDDFASSPACTAAGSKVAVVLGTEGDGLSRRALAAADEVWESVNLANLRENIAPTRGRATLVLRKDADHHMTRVLLRKI